MLFVAQVWAFWHIETFRAIFKSYWERYSYVLLWQKKLSQSCQDFEHLLLLLVWLILCLQFCICLHFFICVECLRCGVLWLMIPLHGLSLFLSVDLPRRAWSHCMDKSLFGVDPGIQKNQYVKTGVTWIRWGLCQLTLASCYITNACIILKALNCLCLYCSARHGGGESWFAGVLDHTRRRRRRVEKQRRRSSQIVYITHRCISSFLPLSQLPQWNHFFPVTTVHSFIFQYPLQHVDDAGERSA